MMENYLVAVGTSDFAEIRQKGYYYIDKSKLIEELVKVSATKVTLITRPRRFGKTLGMRMLLEFFDIQKDSEALFSDLYIAKNESVCKEWRNQYPTVFISFKDIGGLDFESAYDLLEIEISNLYKSYGYLLDSDKIEDFDKEIFKEIRTQRASRKSIKNAFSFLVQMLYTYYQKPVILLIDEYDVPIAKASTNGYYEQMLDMIRAMMSGVLKDNLYLKFGVITGCLRIAKESIFTGLNNLVVNTISDTHLDAYFGFTQAEVDQLLNDTHLDAFGQEIKAWYNGYRFGDQEIYCPWDVMNYIRDLQCNPQAKPKNYWENTSSNEVIRAFLDRTEFDISEQFEILLEGGYIKEKILETLTYDSLEVSQENFWSVLYMTGYLTRMDSQELKNISLLPRQYALRIPNREVEEIFKESVKIWFRDKTISSNREALFRALWNGEEEALTAMISDLLFDTISYYDYRESFYHAFITGLLSNAGYIVESNYENGLGRSDIVVKDRKKRRAVVVEAKWTDTEERMEEECKKALLQIKEKEYAKKMIRMGFHKVILLGIAFYQKSCLVKGEEWKKI